MAINPGATIKITLDTTEAKKQLVVNAADRQGELLKMVNAFAATTIDQKDKATPPKIGVETNTNDSFLMQRDAVLNAVSRIMAANISAELFSDIINEIDTTIGGAPATEKQFPNYLGNWMENRLFGLNIGGNDERSDIHSVENAFTEIKTHSSATEGTIRVGALPIYNFSGDIDEAKKLAELERMTEKMKNFLFIDATSSNVGGKGKPRVHFNSIMLHMVLNLQALFNMIYDKVNSELPNIFTVQTTPLSGSSKGDSTVSMSYTVNMSLTKIGDVYVFTKLYVYHEDILADIKRDRTIRASFFSQMPDLLSTGFAMKQNPEDVQLTD